MEGKVGDAIVAPLVGAWIEIGRTGGWRYYLASLPSWERGLKSAGRKGTCQKEPSLPSWERGLKSESRGRDKRAA